MTPSLFINPASGSVASQAASWQALTGLPVAIATSNINTPATFADLPREAQFIVNAFKASGVQPIVGVPLFSKDPADTFARVASGACDAVMRQVGEILSALPGATIEVRIGWEFNLTSQPWCAAGQEAAYARAFARWAWVFRQLPSGPRFRFHWCVDSTIYPKCDVEKAYPGWGNVHTIGCDLYDNERLDLTPQQRFTLKMEGDQRYGYKGVAWLLGFGARMGKPVLFHEVGSLNENTYFMDRVVRLGVPLFWWNKADGHALAQQPKTLAALKAAA